ncbi:hypothetical protein C8R42DRAFT_727781 [Lentinula raphanica]|nr:hypothetical protein C8R42DRAFT_727781 [Lentinula raphanica]
MAEAYAKHTNGNAHIILIGRNATNAQAIIDSFPKPTAPGAKHEFIYCDATLMAECKRTIDDLLQRLTTINYLVLSPSLLGVQVYQRAHAAHAKAKEAGEDAKVYIVGGPGLGKRIDYDDLGFSKKGYSFWKVRRQFPAYLDVILQEFAAQNPLITFIHAYPGPVRSALADNLEWPLFRMFFKVFFELSFPFSHTESGEYMLHAMLPQAGVSCLLTENLAGLRAIHSGIFGVVPHLFRATNHAPKKVNQHMPNPPKEALKHIIEQLWRLSVADTEAVEILKEYYDTDTMASGPYLLMTIS